jgi:hypothetical protein
MGKQAHRLTLEMKEQWEECGFSQTVDWLLENTNYNNNLILFSVVIKEAVNC